MDVVKTRSSTEVLDVLLESTAILQHKQHAIEYHQKDPICFVSQPKPLYGGDWSHRDEIMTSYFKSEAAIGEDLTRT